MRFSLTLLALLGLSTNILAYQPEARDLVGGDLYERDVLETRDELDARDLYESDTILKARQLYQRDLQVVPLPLVLILTVLVLTVAGGYVQDPSSVPSTPYLPITSQTMPYRCTMYHFRV